MRQVGCERGAEEDDDDCHERGCEQECEEGGEEGGLEIFQISHWPVFFNLMYMCAHSCIFVICHVGVSMDPGGGGFKDLQRPSPTRSPIP